METIGSKFDGQIQSDLQRIFIKPADWKVVMLFNYLHLAQVNPRHVWFRLAGRDLVLDAYHHAIQEHYRFSFEISIKKSLLGFLIG